MRLSRLMADLDLVQTQLAASIREECSVRSRVRLMHRTAALMQRIEDHRPENAREHRAKIDFFFDRARAADGSVGAPRDLAIALDLLNQAPAAVGTRRHDSADAARSCTPLELVTRLAGRGASTADLALVVAASPDRMSVIDPESCHVVTSRGNAAFHARPAETFAGQHMAEVIGGRRYESRARRQMFRCLSGQRVNYYYPLAVQGLGERVIQCNMTPVRPQSAPVEGLLMWLADVTDDLAQPQQFMAGLI